MEHIEVLFKGKQELSYGSTTVLRAKISRHADLISKMYLKSTVPGWRCDTNIQLRLIKNYGTSMIKTAKLFIGGQLIDTLYGEWLYVYNDLFQSADKRAAYDLMTANTEGRYLSGGVNGNSYPSNKSWSDTLSLDITESDTKTLSGITNTSVVSSFTSSA